MASCKECYHYEVCRMHYQQKCELTYETEKEVRRAMREAEKGSPICDHFKDRSRFVELPCKVGDTIFCIIHILGETEIVSSKVQRILFTEDDCRLIVQDNNYIGLSVNDVGKTIFLSREEAEQALKLKERENNAN